MRRSGNALVLFIFILLACSLIGLLGTRFLQFTMTQYQQVFSYYKNYYLAKAGLELALTQLPYRGFGFSQQGDFSFGERNFGSGSRFRVDILGSSTGLSLALESGEGCSDPFVLSGKDSLIFPLFVDVGVPLSQVFSSDPHYDARVDVLNDLRIISNDSSKDLRLGLLVAQGSGLVKDGIYISSGNSSQKDIFSRLLENARVSFGKSHDKAILTWPDSDTLQTYLIMSNMSNSVFHFCLSFPQALPLWQYGIVSSSFVDGQQLDLGANIRQPLPSFFLETTFENEE